MGKYINQDSRERLLPEKGKAQALINDGAIVIAKEDIRIGDVIVVENRFFDAALYVDEYEMKNIEKGFVAGPTDHRPMHFLRYDKASEVVDKS